VQPINPSADERDETHMRGRDFYRDYLCFNGGQQVIADWLNATVDAVALLLSSASSTGDETSASSSSSSGGGGDESAHREYISLLLLLMEQVSWSPAQIAKTRIDKVSALCIHDESNDMLIFILHEFPVYAGHKMSV
jgi:hypothetical protein